MTNTYVVDAVSGKATIVKDPFALLDYTFDWTEWLNDITDLIDTTATDGGATINVFNADLSPIAVGDTFALHEKDVIGKTVVAWITGGIIGNKYAVECEIETQAGRKDARRIYVSIKDR